MYIEMQEMKSTMATKDELKDLKPIMLVNRI